MIWFITVILVILTSVILTSVSAVQATPLCRQLGAHRICLLDIKRSAKNYWEYRAVVTIDHERQPRAVYNCRDRTQTIPQTGRVIPFEPKGAGVLICQILYR